MRESVLAKSKFLIVRIFLWFKIRWKLHRCLMNDKGAMAFIRYTDKTSLDREVLKFISGRQCTAARQDPCITVRPKEPSDWCCRCLALDHLIATDKYQ